MNDPNLSIRIKKYRTLAAADASAEGLRLGLKEEEMTSFLFSADLNAIWDAQHGRQYKKPVYTMGVLQSITPMYNELGFLSDEEYRKIMGKEREK